VTASPNWQLMPENVPVAVRENKIVTKKTPSTLDDEFYERLTNLHAGLDEQQSQRLNARLVLLLANAVEDRATLNEILDLAAKVEQ